MKIFDWKTAALVATMLITLSLLFSCATPYGIEKRHERKLLKLKNDSIRAANTKINRTTTDYNLWNQQRYWNGPFNGWQYNWHGTGFGFYRPQVIIPIKRRNGNNRNINRSRGNRGNRSNSNIIPNKSRNKNVRRPVQVPRAQPKRPSGRVSGPRGGKKNTQ